MRRAPGLPDELMNWYITAVLVVPTPLVYWLFRYWEYKFSTNLSGFGLTTYYPLNILAGGLEVTIVFMFLALAWHFPRVLAAELPRNLSILDGFRGTLIFFLLTMAVSFFFEMGMRRCLPDFAILASYSANTAETPKPLFAMPPEQCRADKDYMMFVWLCLGLMVVGAVYQAARLSWEYKCSRRTVR